MNPTIIHSDIFTLYTLWVFSFIGIIVGSYALVRLSTINRLKTQFLADNFWIIILFAIISARLTFIALNFNIFFQNINLDTILSIFKIWDKGFSLWGGILGGLISLRFICKKEEQDFIKWLDIIIPSILIIITFRNLGLFFDGANYGNETSLPWGVKFENPAIKYTVPIHPTQIYAFLYSGFTTLGLIIANNINKRRGLLSTLGITVFSFFYFLEQFVRGDDTLTFTLMQVRNKVTGEIAAIDIRVVQIVSLIIFIISAYLLYKVYKTEEKEDPKINSKTEKIGNHNI